MTDRERDFWVRRLREVEQELQDVADLRVNYAEHPDEVEDELLEERDDIECRLRADGFGERDAR